MKRSKCPHCKERVAMKLELLGEFKYMYMGCPSIIKICSKCGWIVKEIKL